jgi:hypothetical protein
MTLATITRFAVRSAVVLDTERALRDAGRRNDERFVLWSGQRDGEFFDVSVAHVPAQTAYQLPEGLLVRVDGPALHELNVWLLDHQHVLCAQVHAHPTEAYHSTTDDAFPIVTEVGGLSIVVADFCVGALLAPSSAFYRLSANRWDQLRAREVRRLLEVRK